MTLLREILFTAVKLLPSFSSYLGKDDMLEMKNVIGIDLGGTGSRFVLMNGHGEVQNRLALKTPSDQSEEDSIRFVTEAIRMVSGESEFDGIGIGATGPIDPDGIIRNPDTLAAFSNFELVNALSDRLGVPVFIDNDAVTAALAEYRFGAGRNSRSLLLVTLGTGIGTCLLVEGKPFRGGDGRHPDGGHVDVGRLGEECYCGRSSCWETSASRKSLQRIASLKVNGIVDSVNDLDNLVNLSLEGDFVAQEVFDEYGTRVGEGLANLLGIYRPSDVVIGGGGARYFESFAPAALAYVERVQNWIPTFSFKATQLDDFGGAIGAATLALGDI